MKNEKLPKPASSAYEIPSHEASRRFGIMAEFAEGTERRDERGFELLPEERAARRSLGAVPLC